MKKLLFVLALGAFAACGTGETKEATTDTTVVVPEVVAPEVVAPIVDSPAVVVDSPAVAK